MLRNPEARHGLAADDVLFDDFVGVRHGGNLIPDGFGINDHHWAFAALIQTAR